MAPFVRGGDLATLEPAREASLGEVVIRLCGPERLLLHRVVARPGVEPLTRGDATHEPDPPLAAGELLGRLSRVERQGRRLRLGLGPERLLLAWLSGHGWLRPLLVALRRALGASGEGGGAARV
jgi:hypothetical protein